MEQNYAKLDPISKHYGPFKSIEEGSIIKTSDNILAIFGYSFIRNNQNVFFSPFANNIGEHICEDGVFRIFDDGWRYATIKETDVFKSLLKEHLGDRYEDYLPYKLKCPKTPET